MARSLLEVLKQMAKQLVEQAWQEISEWVEEAGSLPSWAVQLFLEQEGKVSVQASLLRNDM